jgi:hypothetical protein
VVRQSAFRPHRDSHRESAASSYEEALHGGKSTRRRSRYIVGDPIDELRSELREHELPHEALQPPEVTRMVPEILRSSELMLPSTPNSVSTGTSGGDPRARAISLEDDRSAIEWPTNGAA